MSKTLWRFDVPNDSRRSSRDFSFLSAEQRDRGLFRDTGGLNSGGFHHLQPHPDLAHRGPVKDAAVDRKAGRKKSRVDGKNRHRGGTRSSAADWPIDCSSGRLASDRFSQTPGATNVAQLCIAERHIGAGGQNAFKSWRRRFVSHKKKKSGNKERR